jgi:hypothetical protein
MEEKNYCLRCEQEITEENWKDYRYADEDGLWCDKCVAYCEMLAESKR